MTYLSTTTLMAALAQEPRWSTQIGIARTLQKRKDVFNVTPLCEFIVRGGGNREVQRAVAECIAATAPQEGVRWLAGRIQNPAAPPEEQERALRCLADMRIVSLTLPVLMKVCRYAADGPTRRAAFFRLGRSGRLDAVRFLIRLSGANDPVLMQQAKAALETILSLHGGLNGATDRLLDMAGDRVRRGRRLEAARFLCTAIRLCRLGGVDAGQRLRGRLAA
jgi:hypothetical protein